MKIRKQVYELTKDDLVRFPIWEFASDEEGKDRQDEATVRPYKVVGILDPDGRMFVVRATFTFADDSQLLGYLTPPLQNNSNDIGEIQPIIITEHGQVNFWNGILTPSKDTLTKNYNKLGRNAKQIFPVRFESDVKLVNGPIHGILSGFLYLEGNEVKTAI